MYEYFTPSPPVSLDVSQNGLLSYAAGNEALVYKNWQVAREKPYMIHKATTNVSSVRFNPYEDFLGPVDNVGHAAVELVTGLAPTSHVHRLADRGLPLSQGNGANFAGECEWRVKVEDGDVAGQGEGVPVGVL